MAAKVTFVNQNNQSQAFTFTLFGPEKDRVKVANVLAVFESAVLVMEDGNVLESNEEGFSTYSFVAGRTYDILLVPGNGETARRLSEIERVVERFVPGGSGRKVRISEISSTEWAHVQSDGGVKIKAFEFSDSRPLVSYQPKKVWNEFVWDSGLTERQQAARYLRHLSEYVDVKSSRSAFADVASDWHFLDFPAFHRNFVGTTDVAISSRSSVGLHIPGNGLRCILELKKDFGKGLNSSPGYQAIVSLLLASMKYKDEDVVAFLTDLRETWYIFWREDSVIFHYLFDSSNDAVGYLEHYLEFGAQLRANPNMLFNPEHFVGLDVLWQGKRQKLLQIEELGASCGDRLSELKGLLGAEDEAYFDAHTLVQALRSLPIFWDISSVGLDSRGSGGSGSDLPATMYI